MATTGTDFEGNTTVWDDLGRLVATVPRALRAGESGDRREGSPHARHDGIVQAISAIADGKIGLVPEVLSREAARELIVCGLCATPATADMSPVPLWRVSRVADRVHLMSPAPECLTYSFTCGAAREVGTAMLRLAKARIA